MRQGSSSCTSDSVGAKRSPFSVPGSPLETRAADISRSFIYLEWNERLVVVVVVAHVRLVSSVVVMIEGEWISKIQHTGRQKAAS